MSPSDLAQRLVDGLPDAVIVKDLGGRIVFWNHGAESMYGLNDTEVIGKPMSIIGSPGKWFEVLRLIERASSGEHVSHHETTRMRADGSTVRACLSIFPILDEHRRPVYVATIDRGIPGHTCRITAPSTDPACAAGQAVIEKDVAGTIVCWSRTAERLYGFQARDVVGHPATILAAPGRQEETRRLMSRVRDGESVRGIRSERTKKDGSTIVVDVSLNPIFNARGEVLGIRSVSARAANPTRVARDPVATSPSHGSPPGLPGHVVLR